MHSFYVEVDPSAERKPTEPEIELKLVSLAQLALLILAGEFVLQLHIGTVLSLACVVIPTLARSWPFKEVSGCGRAANGGANFVVGAIEVSWPSKGC